VNRPCVQSDDPSKTGQRVFFLHVHKAGGTTICHLAQENGCYLFPDYNCNVGIETGYRFVAEENLLPDNLWARTEGMLRFTMLREPIARAHSHFVFECEFKLIPPTIESAAAAKACTSAEAYWEVNPDNFVTRQLCGKACAFKPRGALEMADLQLAKDTLDRMDLVLIVERFAEAGGLLNRTLRWTDPLPARGHQNSMANLLRNKGGVANLARGPALKASQESARLRELHLLDSMLYDYARARFLRDLRSLAAGTAAGWEHETELQELEAAAAEGPSAEQQRALEAFAAASAAQGCRNPCCAAQPPAELGAMPTPMVVEICNHSLPDEGSSVRTLARKLRAQRRRRRKGGRGSRLLRSRRRGPGGGDDTGRGWLSGQGWSQRHP